MIRLSTLFWLVLVSATGFAMFAVKYEVQALADQLVQTRKTAADAEHDVRVLDAEWAYLNRPDALAQMNQRYLQLAPIATKQLYASVADLPMRPTPAPPVEVAAATLPAAPGVQQGGAANQPLPAAAKEDSRPSAEAPMVRVALETRVTTAEPARVAPVKAVFRPRSHPVRSLDALIAQIAESR